MVVVVFTKPPLFLLFALLPLLLLLLLFDGEMFRPPTTELLLAVVMELMDSDGEMPDGAVERGGEDPVGATPCGTGMLLIHGIWKGKSTEGGFN